ncbi:MAG: 23S rRNA (pseudouridine(1915)-N(3))-methyltransferase RlmH [Clostridia bacterium]|nr:23S rRNA (pseudouridine(1915)-N(3))-methyltransferase RlmH [Clostridia bacterium]
MVKITIISVGTLKEDYLRDAISEYKKRLSQYARVEEINIKEEAIRNEDDGSEISRALSLEGDKILSALPRDARKIALCVEGKQYDSVELANVIGEANDECGKLALVIGSSHGLADKVKSACDRRISFSKMTFPHQLMRVILYEVLYRSFTILAGKRYHK